MFEDIPVIVKVGIPLVILGYIILAIVKLKSKASVIVHETNKIDPIVRTVIQVQEQIPPTVDNTLYLKCLSQLMIIRKQIDQDFPKLSDDDFLAAMRRVVYDVRNNTPRNT